MICFLHPTNLWGDAQEFIKALSCVGQAYTSLGPWQSNFLFRNIVCMVSQAQNPVAHNFCRWALDVLVQTL